MCLHNHSYTFTNEVDINMKVVSKFFIASFWNF